MKLLIQITILVLSTFIVNRTVAQNAGIFDYTFNGSSKFALDFGLHNNLTNVKNQPVDQKIFAARTVLNPAFATLK